jgi:thiamine biosynthesis lipoprotein
MENLFTVAKSSPVVSTENAGEKLRRLTFQALGTRCEVQYAVPHDYDKSTLFERAVVDWVSAFEAKYSRFKPTSLISRINAAAGFGWIEIDPEMEQLLSLCDMIHKMTNGVLDPTALPLIQLWNWKAERPVLPSVAEINRTHNLVGWDKVRREPGRIFLPKPGMALDFGGFGKEYAVDMVAQMALSYGISNVLVDFGHDLRALGAPPGRPAWHIGLEDPKLPGFSWASMAVTGNRGIASSGDYVRCFKADGRRYGHIIDPRTGWPVGNGCMQATVVANSCLQAGVLSTSAFVLGVPAGVAFIQSYPGAEGVLITETARAQTRGFYHYVAS